MKLKIIALTLVLSLVVFLAFILIANKNRANKIKGVAIISDSVNMSVQKKYVIAACPSCNIYTNKLDPNKYSVINTNSTSESIFLLENGIVDFIIAGRTLKPDEPYLDYHIFKDGYSFISSSEMTIHVNELSNYKIYTDLNSEQIKSLFDFKEVVRVDNVYDYLDRGIVITTWENTDYTKANIVHVYEENGERLSLSRRPTLYCSMLCDKEISEDISIAFSD